MVEPWPADLAFPDLRRVDAVIFPTEFHCTSLLLLPSHRLGMNEICKIMSSSLPELF